MTFTPRVLPFGEAALLIELCDEFDEDVVAWARTIADEWERTRQSSAVPAYASVVATFDPDRVSATEAEATALTLVRRGPRSVGASGSRSRLIEVPARYDGPDLAEVAERSRLSVDELVALHAGRTYAAYFLGFLPGFAYLGRLDPRIVAPRLDRPRERVPRGAIAVADGQTAVYPSASPGGWRLIGSSDLVMFDPTAAEPARIRAGDRVRFVPS